MKGVREFLGAYPMGVFALLTGVVALIYLASEHKRLKKIFDILPSDTAYAAVLPGFFIKNRDKEEVAR